MTGTVLPTPNHGAMRIVAIRLCSLAHGGPRCRVSAMCVGHPHRMQRDGHVDVGGHADRSARLRGARSRMLLLVPTIVPDRERLAVRSSGRCGLTSGPPAARLTPRPG